MVDWLIAIQRWLYGGMAEGMRASDEATALVGLIDSADGARRAGRLSKARPC